MGNFRIVIGGCGCHHNAHNPADANLLLLAVVAVMAAAGHTIRNASFQVEGQAAEDVLGEDGSVKPVPPATLDAFAGRVVGLVVETEKKIEASPVEPFAWADVRSHFESGGKVEERTVGGDVPDDWKLTATPNWDDKDLEFRVAKESPSNDGESRPVVADTPGDDAGSGAKSGAGELPPVPVVDPEAVRESLNSPK